LPFFIVGNEVVLVFIVCYYVHTRIHTCAHTRTHARTHAHTHTNAHTCTHTRTLCIWGIVWRIIGCVVELWLKLLFVPELFSCCLVFSVVACVCVCAVCSHVVLYSL